MKSLSPELIALAKSLAGIFENRSQAQESPVWYVPLRLWLRPVPLFAEDSLTLFAEQANLVNVHLPYRSRLWRLRQLAADPLQLVVDHYQFIDQPAFKGAGQDRDRLLTITPNDVKLLTPPGCRLTVTVERNAIQGDRFRAFPESAQPCTFCNQAQTFHVALGFEVQPGELKTFDKGINPETGQPLWGALMGPYCFSKIEDWSQEFGLIEEQ